MNLEIETHKFRK